MKTIHEFTLNPGMTVLQLPVMSEMLSVQIQDGEPRLWVLLNPKEEVVEAHIWTFKTGGEIPADLNLSCHIGTFQMPETGFVFHAFLENGVGRLVVKWL